MTPRPRLLSRRAFLASALSATGAAAVAGWARWIEPEWLEVTHTAIPCLPPGASPIRILHLSDLHRSSVVSLEFIARAIDLGLRHRPHLTVLTGDFVTGATIPDPEAYQDVLQRLSRHTPCLACLGNHDAVIDGWHPDTGHNPHPDHRPVRHLLQKAGITLLFNETLTWFHGRQPLEIIGLGDLWSCQCHPDAAFPAEDPNWPRLVLCHNPDTKDLLRPYRWNVMLCGHSHGGQLRLPLLGSPLAPIRDKRYVSGLHPWEGRWIFTTRGVGNLHGIRINCRPEVSLLDLVPSL